ncbi:MAG: cell wall hydrolase, partial [Sedimenticolaceae bacterium]
FFTPSSNNFLPYRCKPCICFISSLWHHSCVSSDMPQNTNRNLSKHEAKYSHAGRYGKNLTDAAKKMERRKYTNRCKNSIAATLFIAALHFALANVVAAAESANKHLTGFAHVDRSIADKSVLQGPGGEPSTQRDIQVENEVLCLALNIYFEARSEAEKGQLAVGHVVMNRVANRHYPNTVCEVVRQGGEERLHRCQFSWWCDGHSDKPLNQKAWLKSLKLAIAVYVGHSEDPTHGALWYHADYANPYWSDTLVVGEKIGQHVFYLKKKQREYALK